MVLLIPTAEILYHPGYTRRQWIFLLFFFVSTAIPAVGLSMQRPLYPPEARSRGISASVYGPILSADCAFMALTSIFATRIEKMGLKGSYGWSAFTVCIAKVITGSAHFVESHGLFITMSIIGFGLNGIGGGGNFVSVYMLLLSVFPTGTSTAIGIIESGFLAGMCFGPMIGELLFNGLGYAGAFFVLGFISLLITCAIYWMLPSVPEPTDIHHITLKDMAMGYWEIVQCPSVMIYVLALICLQMGGDFVSTILEPGLLPFNLSRNQVGFMFLSSGLPQLLAPFWGFLLDRLKHPELFLAGSAFLIAFSVLFLGPVPFLSIERSIIGTAISLVVIGLGQGLMDVATVVNFQLEVKEKRQNESNSVNFSFIAIINAFMSGIGGLVAPAMAGIMFDQVGFGNSFLFIFITHSTLALIIIFYMLQRNCHPRSIILSNVGYEQLPSS